ncbi:unnamed protein product, partial [Cyprideis torosa]
MYDASSLAYRQGRTRRGSYAAFLDINHPDIIQFLEMRKPTGDQNLRTLNLNHGVNISNKFMEVVERSMLDPEANDDWELINPANVYSAARERSIGIGALGFHAYLQKNGLAFEGVMAKMANMDIFRHINKECNRGDTYLADKRGACPDAAKHGVNRRFSHHMAIAPNASSSILMGNTSPSIEPYRANAYRQDTLSGAYVTKNKWLKRELAKLGMDDDDTWASIIANDGSVQHLDIDDNLKAIYRTAMELDQRWIVELASDRQGFIDQGQSVNLFFRPDVEIKYLHAVHFMAWKLKLKSLYYLRSDKGDLDIGDGYYTHYIPAFKQPEVRMMMSGFAGREALHVAAYAHLIETLGLPESTYNEFLEYGEMVEKHEYFKGLDGLPMAEKIATISAF